MARVSRGPSPCWWGWGRAAFSCIAGAVPPCHPGKQVSVSREVKCNTQHFHPVYLPSRNENLHSHKSRTWIFMAVLFIIAKTRKSTQMLFSGWIDRQTVVCPKRWKTTEFQKGACYWYPARISKALCWGKEGQLKADMLYVPFTWASCKDKIKGMEGK